ncbi:MAG TPA: hypothetical protein PK987_06400 [Ferruginibacter sp.]|nr:hypothetical protein [Ferruginibacter sp.]
MKLINSVLYCVVILALAACQKPYNINQQSGTLKITFKNTVKGVPVQLNTGIYTNNFGEQYNISKLKYYISHVSINNTTSSATSKEYYLVDESVTSSQSFSFDSPVGSYSSVSFLLGVDSTRNVSGAQTGALDPLNDMFWTWNSGYIMAKMEGTSPQSTIVNNKVEYHIGGFAGANSVLKNINLIIPVSSINLIDIKEGKTSEVFIDADFDKWWQGVYDLKIAGTASVTMPGTLAKSISDNYANMFSITNVINN